MKLAYEKLQKNEFSTILFDLDGTLIDSEASAAQTVQTCFLKWGIQIDSADPSYVTGRTWESAFQFLFQKYSLPIPESQAKKEIMQTYRENLETGLIEVPGGRKAVEALAQHYSLALVSGSSRNDILWALKKMKIDHFFQVILGAEDYSRSKPDPEGYKKALTLLQKDASSGLVFEDSTAGIASARAAGLCVAAITSTNHFKQDTSQAHFTIADLTRVTVEWVENLRMVHP